MTMRQRREEAGHALATRMARLLGQIEQMPDDGLPVKCSVCRDTGWAYSPKRGTVVRCPACQCPVCHGLAFIPYDVPPDDKRFGQLYPCPANCDAIQAVRAAHQSAIRRYSELPAEYVDLTFSTFDRLPDLAREGKGMARAFAEEFVTAPGHMVEAGNDQRDWLGLWGPHGRGKTGLAAAIVNALAEAGEPALYTRLGDFFEAVQRRYSKARAAEGYGDDFGSDTAEDVIDAAKRAPVLVVDDADVADVRENKLSIFEKVVRGRHDARLPTVFTTNLSPAGFEARWGPRIASVVNARTHWVLMEGPSLRPAAAEWSDHWSSQ